MFESATKVVLYYTDSIVLRLGLAEGCAKPSLPIRDDPIPIPLFCMSRLKV